MFERIALVTRGEVTPGDFFPDGSPGEKKGLAEAQTPFDPRVPHPLHAEATALGLDADAIAQKALREAISAEKARRWQEENREAIEAWNRWTEDNPLPLAEYRMF